MNLLLNGLKLYYGVMVWYVVWYVGWSILNDCVCLFVWQVNLTRNGIYYLNMMDFTSEWFEIVLLGFGLFD